MATIVLVMGESGTGKSTSLRNFKKGEASIINVSGKPLPFRSELNTFNSDDYNQIKTMLQKAQAKSIVIDDAQYLMAFEFMNRAKEKGYNKFTDIGFNFYDLVQTANKLSNDKVVYFLSHIERTQDGSEKCKTIGKLVDEKITLEGMFTIVLKTVVDFDGNNQAQFNFATVNSGSDTVKTPMEMFNTPLIPNDLKEVDRIIRNYYNLPTNEITTETKNKEQNNGKNIMEFARR